MEAHNLAMKTGEPENEDTKICPHQPLTDSHFLAWIDIQIDTKL